MVGIIYIPGYCIARGNANGSTAAQETQLHAMHSGGIVAENFRPLALYCEITVKVSTLKTLGALHATVKVRVSPAHRRGESLRHSLVVSAQKSERDAAKSHLFSVKTTPQKPLLL